jgi:hypothetical protein
VPVQEGVLFLVDHDLAGSEAYRELGFLSGGELMLEAGGSTIGDPIVGS